MEDIEAGEVFLLMFFGKEGKHCTPQVKHSRDVRFLVQLFHNFCAFSRDLEERRSWIYQHNLQFSSSCLTALQYILVGWVYENSTL